MDPKNSGFGTQDGMHYRASACFNVTDVPPLSCSVPTQGVSVTPLSEPVAHVVSSDIMADFWEMSKSIVEQVAEIDRQRIRLNLQ